MLMLTYSEWEIMTEKDVNSASHCTCLELHQYPIRGVVGTYIRMHVLPTYLGSKEKTT